MPNFSGIWTVTQQMQARGASTWPAPPGAPTIGTATAGGSNCASVTFTAPACIGYPATGITGYRVISTPGCFSNTGASSPLVVTGLTTGTSYTFKAQATNATGYGALSAASNSITAAVVTCATYTTAGTFTWVAPTGVTSVAAVVVAGGGQNGAGSLSYKNSITVVPGTGYTVVVGAAAPASSGSSGSGGTSSFVSAGTVSATSAATRVGDGGGLGNTSFGGGAGGYAGNGGVPANPACGSAANGAAGTGGAGGGSGRANGSSCIYCTIGQGAGGGVGLFGQGSSGAGGTGTINSANNVVGTGGGGGSGGTAGGTTTTTSGSSVGATGGSYGGASGRMKYQINCVSTALSYGAGGGGAVRIVWAGGSRGTPSFPSTNVGA